MGPLRVGIPATLIAVGVLTSVLSGCGRRGDLEPALDPSVEAATSAGEKAAPVVRRSKRVPITPSKDPFILDPLL